MKAYLFLLSDCTPSDRSAWLRGNVIVSRLLILIRNLLWDSWLRRARLRRRKHSTTGCQHGERYGVDGEQQ